MSIMISATAFRGNEVKNIMDFAKSTEPLCGSFAKYFLSIGLLAAGIISAITALLGAAYITNNCFGWIASLKDLKFRVSWFLILILGVIFSSLQLSPIEVIKFAQIANGTLLPIEALFLLWVVNKLTILGRCRNKLVQNIISIFIILNTIVLGFKSIFKVVIMHQIDINCDMGEGIGNERELMPYIQSCNIACGGHAGSELLMKEIVALAMKYKVKIGAHPSYPDIENFGRRTMKISSSDLSRTILDQIDSLKRIVVNCGGRMNHIKAHGALYNDLLTNEQLAIEYLNIIEVYKKDIKLFVPYQSVIARFAVRDGFEVVYEAFADRNYNNDLSLVSRNDKNALITDPKIMLRRILEVKNSGIITTILGKKLPIRAGTFCLHSDSENVTECIKYLYQNLN